ncbi:MAG: hypothetical protein ACOX1X_04490 [Dethiobacteria bacterium]|jgi:hypothetical protein
MKLEQSPGELSSVNLLVSLLVRFPEIFTINYNLAEAVFKLSFMLKVNVEQERYIKFRKHFSDCLKAYYGILEFEQPVSPKISKKLIKAWTLLQVTFYKKSICFEEINLVSSLILNEFKKEIIVDTRENSYLSGEREIHSEDFIECLLPEKKKQEQENLFAFREAGKVYVFDK